MTAIVFDNATQAAAGNANSVQWTHTASGANNCLVVGAGLRNAASISAMAYATVALAQNGRVVAGNTWFIWSLAGNATGANALSAVLVGATTDDICFGACTYNNVSQANPVGTVGIWSDTTATVHSLSVSSTAGNVVFGLTGGSNGLVYAEASGGSPPMNHRGAITASSAFTLIFSDSTATGATTGMTWTSTVVNSSGMIGIPISSTAVAVGVVPFTLTTLNAGR